MLHDYCLPFCPGLLAGTLCPAYQKQQQQLLSYESFCNNKLEDEGREEGSKSLFERTGGWFTSKTFSNPPDGQIIRLREGKTVVETKHSSAGNINHLETDKVLKWADFSGFEVVNCGNYGLGFNKNSALFFHQRTLSGGKPCFCSECG